MSARPSSKRTLNQAIGALRNRAHVLKLPPGKISTYYGTPFITFGTLQFALNTAEVVMPEGCIFVNYRDDSSMKSAIEELKKAAGKAPAK